MHLNVHRMLLKLSVYEDLSPIFKACYKREKGGKREKNQGVWYNLHFKILKSM